MGLFSRERDDNCQSFSEWPDILPSTDIPSRYDGITVGERIGLLNHTILVDFAITPQFTDPNSSLMCIVATTSNGQTGTLTHLSVGADVAAYVQRLEKLIPEPAGVCLSGGETIISDRLLHQLLTQLRKKGFLVDDRLPYSELGGSNIIRRATLHPDRVFVEKTYHGGEQHWHTLTFPTR